IGDEAAEEILAEHGEGPVEILGQTIDEPAEVALGVDIEATDAIDRRGFVDGVIPPRRRLRIMLVLGIFSRERGPDAPGISEHPAHPALELGERGRALRLSSLQGLSPLPILPCEAPLRAR